MIKHVLSKNELSCNFEVEIAESLFYQIKDHKTKFINALEIEEKYDIVIENYKELECELLRLGMDTMLFSDLDWHGSMKERRLIGRRISNLLSSCRLYVDSTKHHMSSIYGKGSDNHKRTESFFSEQYDACFGYRLMETLRNLAQHAGMPFSYSAFSGWLDHCKEQMAITVSPALMVEEIPKKGSKFKASVRDELDLDKNHIDIKALVREYLECISNVNNAVREMLAADIKLWECTLSSSIEMFREKYSKQEPDKSIATLCAVRIDDVEDQPEMIQLFVDFIDHRADLLKKNRHLINLSKWFVTGQIEKHLK